VRFFLVLLCLQEQKQITHTLFSLSLFTGKKDKKNKKGCENACAFNLQFAHHSHTFHAKPAKQDKRWTKREIQLKGKSKKKTNGPSFFFFNAKL